MDETSACIDGWRKVPLSTDHLKINKYSGSDDPCYIAVYPFIVDIARGAVRIVQDRLKRKQIKRTNLFRLILLQTARLVVEDNSGKKNFGNKGPPDPLTSYK